MSLLFIVVGTCSFLVFDSNIVLNAVILLLVFRVRFIEITPSLESHIVLDLLN